MSGCGMGGVIARSGMIVVGLHVGHRTRSLIVSFGNIRRKFCRCKFIATRPEPGNNARMRHFSMLNGTLPGASAYDRERPDPEGPMSAAWRRGYRKSPEFAQMPAKSGAFAAQNSVPS